jgi:hypothetical protein
LQEAFNASLVRAAPNPYGLAFYTAAKVPLARTITFAGKRCQTFVAQKDARLLILAAHRTTMEASDKQEYSFLTSTI